MARGIQPGPEQLLEEAHVEAVAVLYDAVERDVVELSDLRTLLDDLHRGLADATPCEFHKREEAYRTERV